MSDDDRRPRPDEVTSHSPVRAKVLVQPGLGALWGLAAGDALGRRARAESGAAAAGAPGAPGTIDDAQAIADMLMDRGDYHDGEAARPSGRSDGLAALARTAVIGLFYAGWPEKRLAVAASDAGDDDIGAALACAAFDGALAASVWSRAAPIDQLAAALADLNAAALALDERLSGRHAEVVAATEAVHETLRTALSDEASAIDVGTAGGALAFALRHLLQESAPEAAMAALFAQAEAGSAQGAVLGALLGARHGRDALPASWVAAAETLAVSDLAGFVESGPFLGWGLPR